jgi:hypothetical protein
MASMAQHPVLAILEEMRDTVESKANDYADGDNVYSNFEGSAKLAGISVEQVFMVMIGVKVERLRQLISGTEPNFESIEDTILDLANYAALWLGYRREEERLGLISNRLSELIYDQEFLDNTGGSVL